MKAVVLGVRLKGKTSDFDSKPSFVKHMHSRSFEVCLFARNFEITNEHTCTIVYEI